MGIPLSNYKLKRAKEIYDMGENIFIAIDKANKEFESMNKYTNKKTEKNKK
ncbi:TPA: hypothetical protein KPJ62_003703 [Clostridioides difficile]|nr:hypothetical protein [Clostridioides difficile]